MSGTQVSSFGNVLFNAPQVYQAAQTYQTNQLLQQADQQKLGANEMDMIGRAAQGVLSLPADQRPGAYTAAVGNLQRYGFAKNAPSEYPGDAALQGIANQSIPVADQYKLGLVTPPGTQAAIDAALGRTPTAPGTTAAPPGGGDFATGLAAAESGGKSSIINPSGYTGTYQFGKQRLQQLGYYTPAPGEDMSDNRTWSGRVSIPGFNVTDQASFAANPAAQQVAFNTHLANIDQAITNTPGAAQFDKNGLRAVAHLGGVDGMQRFVSSGGLYDPGDANGTKLSTYYRRFSGGAAAPAGTATAASTPPPASSAAGPVVVGDSLASAGGLGGSGVVGASPSAVRAQIAEGVRNGAYTGKDVVLSSGASNAPGDLANVEGQLKQLRDAGSVTLLGVGPAIEAKNPGTNAALAKLAAQYGARFQPLPTDQMSPDGIHPNAAGYAALKTATAPPGAAPQSGRYQVASNAPVAPPSSTAQPGQPPAAPAPAAPPSPPPNALAPPAPQPASAQPQSNLPHASEVPTGVNSAQYQQAMELQRKALALEAINDPTGRSQRLAAGLRAQAALALQVDSVVQGPGGVQIHTLTGAQSDPAKPLPHYQYDPNAGGPGIPGYIDTTGTNKPEINPARRMNVRPDGSVINDQGQVIAPAMPGATPPLGSFEVQKGDYTRDAEELPKIAAAGQNAQTAQVRLQTMLDLLPKISTGAGGYTRTQLANLAETAGFPGIAQTLIAHSSDGDAGAAQEFGKLTLAAAGAAERGDLGSRGSLGALKLYQQNNPGLDLRPGANKAMIGMQLIAAQADTDYSQAALSYANKYATDFRTGQGPYSPLANFDLQWQQHRNPQVYSAAMGALNGQPPATWAKGLSDDEYKRALDIVSRASPSAKVQGKSGWISMQPNATPPPPPGFTVVQ